MKGNGIERDTLDGVITALEKVDDTWQNGRNGLQYADLRDALHYLQDYRMLSNDFAEKRQELEDEKARYQEAVRNCEEAELKYRKLAQSLGEVGNAEIPLNPNVVFRPEGVYCGVCGSRLDQDREEE